MLKQCFFNGASNDVHGILVGRDKLIVVRLQQTAIDQRYRHDPDDFLFSTAKIREQIGIRVVDSRRVVRLGSSACEPKKTDRECAQDCIENQKLRSR